MDTCSRIIDSRPTDGSLRMMRNTGTIVWNCNCCKNQEHAIEVGIQDIKEIRKKNDSEIQVFYGNNFVLDCAHFEAYNSEERDLLIEKFDAEIEALKSSSYKANLERMLMRKVNIIKKIYDANSETVISIPESKCFFQEIDLTVNEKQISKLFHSLKKDSSIFVRELLKFVFDEMIRKQEAILEYRLEECPSLKGDYINNSNQISFSSFKRFLSKEQGLTSTQLNKDRDEILNAFVLDVENDYLIPSEFINYLFCEKNEIMDEIYIQEMSKPLSYYYIASSHNTYLTGDQFASLSSEEAYARVLRQGCRCIELDCWPSQDKIIITHGFTATSKIPFEGVLKTIKRHAFETTEYPLILSIENHCPVELQREMARLFISIFGDLLLTEPYKEQENILPSPNNLKKKIILKFKKICKEDANALCSNDDSDEYESEYSDVIRRGKLYFKRNKNAQWRGKVFSLSEMFLIATDENYNENSQRDESFCHELWYHGVVSNEKILEELQSMETCSHIKTGSFFVANIAENEKEYLMLFVWKVQFFHLQIERQLDDYNNQIFTVNYEEYFKSLEELIAFYTQNDLHIILKDTHSDTNEPTQQEIRLQTTIYRTNDHRKMEWFHSYLSKPDSEIVFKKLNKCGSFLVRPSQSSPVDLTLVFCSTKKIVYRLKVIRYDNTFMIDKSNQRFKSVVNLIEYYQYNEIFNSKTTLTFPITKKLVDEILQVNYNEETIYCLEEAELSDNEPSFSSFVYDFETVNIWAFKMQINEYEYIELGCRDVERAKLWMSSIRGAIDALKQNKEVTEKKYKIAKEMSDITIYFQKGDFNKAFYSNGGKGAYNEVYSVEETKMNHVVSYQTDKIDKFHKVSISRIYPSGLRVYSSNFNPLPFWFSGSQMVALNYQTGDLGMQLNHAWFRQNKNCGYVLRPHCSDDITYDPLYLEITVLGARIVCGGKWRINPVNVDIEIHGMNNEYKIHRSILDGDSICMINKNPTPEKHEFLIKIPEFALLQFTVYGKNRSNTIGQYTIHVNDLRERGYRNVPLKNKFSEPLFFSSLLIYIHKWKKIELLERMEELINIWKSTEQNGGSFQLWKKELESLERIKNSFLELDSNK